MNPPLSRITNVGPKTVSGRIVTETPEPTQKNGEIPF